MRRVNGINAEWKQNQQNNQLGKKKYCGSTIKYKLRMKKYRRYAIQNTDSSNELNDGKLISTLESDGIYSIKEKFAKSDMVTLKYVWSFPSNCFMEEGINFRNFLKGRVSLAKWDERKMIKVCPWFVCLRQQQ